MKKRRRGGHWGKREPAVADLAEQALGIELENIRVLGEKTVALRESIWVLGCFNQTVRNCKDSS
jgi:hypothetical protein